MKVIQKKLWQNTTLEITALKVIKALQAQGFEAYFVGGCVRDSLLGLTPKDIDITTSAKPKEIKKIFKKTIAIGEAFGVITVVIDGLGFEVATFRAEAEYLDGRRPTEVRFADAKEDAIRRDFTINALFYDPIKEEIVDFSKMIEDLNARRLQTIGDADCRFSEDYLRMLRAIRFTAKLELTPDPKMLEAIKKHAHQIKKISAERIFTELGGMLTSGYAKVAFELLAETTLLPLILPEVAALKGCPQNPVYHPEGDVWNHTMIAISRLEKGSSLELAWSTLLHDIGKPATLKFKEDGSPTSHAHEFIGAKIAVKMLKKLKASNRLVKSVESNVLSHMKFMMAQNMKESTLRKFVADEQFDDKLELHRIDALSGAGNLENYDFVSQYIETLKLTGGTALPPPLISGKELKELGLKPGREFAKILSEVQELQLNGKIKTAEEAIAWIKTR